MNKNSTERLVSKCFPDEDPFEILAILETFKNTTSRTYVAHEAMLYLCREDVNLLKGAVATLSEDRSLLSQYRHWLSIKMNFEKGPTYLIHFSQLIERVAMSAVTAGFESELSHGCVVMRRKTSEGENLLIIIPLIDSDVFLTRDHEAILVSKNREELGAYTGEFASAENFPAKLHSWLSEG